MRALEDLLLPQGWRLMGAHHMFLPGREFSAALPEAFSYQWYDRETVKAFYPNRLWPNALSQEENSLRPDVIALAAFDGEKMAGLAGASADGETLWQVGIDVRFPTAASVQFPDRRCSFSSALHGFTSSTQFEVLDISSCEPT